MAAKDDEKSLEDLLGGDSKEDEEEEVPERVEDALEEELKEESSGDEAQMPDYDYKPEYAGNKSLNCILIMIWLYNCISWFLFSWL